MIKTGKPEEELNLIAEEGNGKLYECKGFLVPVLSGSSREMGTQYGTMMVESMQKAYDVLVKPAFKSGVLTDEDAKVWAERAVSTFSNHNREFYKGLEKSTGWSQVKIGILDQLMEFGAYQAALHTFSGCTSIFAWKNFSKDGHMYIGRNMDWSMQYNEFPQVLTVINPDDGRYRYASIGWPGIYCALTALNEHGVYLDVHDGTSMGGIVIYKDRPPITGILSDIISDTASVEGLIKRLNGTNCSASLILNLADESSAASMECSSLGGNRVRLSDNNSMVAVNSFLNPDWGIHRRDTLSHSLERLSNMTRRLDENKGSIDVKKTCELMDLPLFEADGTIGKGCTKPTKIDIDQTTHQVVTDVSKRKIWLKVPNPDYFVDWTPFDLKTLWR